MLLFYDVGICQYPNDNPLGGLGRFKFPLLLDQQVSISSGSVDIDALMKLVDFFTGKVILFWSSLIYDTTFEKAYDDINVAG